MTNPGLKQLAAGWCAAMFVAAMALAAQDAPPATQPAEKTPPPSLDDLLEIDEPAGEGAAEAAEQHNQDELQRELTEKEAGDAFEQAMAQMGVSAERLDTKFDPGLGTQRVQEDIIAKLARLIDLSRRRGSPSSSSSSSSSSSQQQQQQQNNSQANQKPGQRQSQPQSNQRNQNPANSQEGDPPAMQQGDLNQMMEQTSKEWGSLPQRVRDEYNQGRNDKYSNLYELLTSEYYRRIAEGGTP